MSFCLGRQIRVSGSANPRSRPFRAGHLTLTRLHQLYGAKVGQLRAKRNAGSLAGFPPILQLQTRSGCNASCAICPQRTLRGVFPDASITDSLFAGIVEQCASEPGLRGVGFVLQNEPLTDPMLFDRIRHFRERVRTRAMTFIVTNGTLLTPGAADELLACGLDALHISCNGFHRDDYESLNEGKSWDMFRSNVDRFLARDLSGTAVMMSFVRTKKFGDQCERAIAEWRKRGVPCFVHGINNRGGLVEDYGEYARPVAAERLGVRLRKGMVKALLGCCPYPFLQMSVLATGQVLICTHDWGRRQIVGDLNVASIREVWNGPAMRRLRLMHLAGEAGEIPTCRDCDVFENAAFA
jgi:hypothetical protein